MPGRGDQQSEARFASFVEALAGVIGHADRASPLRDYCTGLLMPAERKSVEPIAAVTAPSRVAAQHQSLLHFVGQSAWSDEAVLAKVRALTLPALERSGPVEAWIIDDTGFPQEGPARGHTPVLRPARQAGQLPGRGLPIGSQRGGQPAGRLQALPASGLGRRSGAASQGRRA
jgi:hypothetical protein